MIETFTEMGFPTGVAVSRDQAHRDGIIHKTVHVWIIHSEKKLLLQRRAACKESHPTKWDISSAGHISYGDSTLSAAIRECREELGLEIFEEEMRCVGTLFQEYHSRVPHFVDREWSDIFVVYRDVAIADLTLQEDEVSEVRWFSAEELRAGLRENSDQFVPHPEEYGLILNILFN